jgi:hypothetical protein
MISLSQLGFQASTTMTSPVSRDFYCTLWLTVLGQIWSIGNLQNTIMKIAVTSLFVISSLASNTVP